ncbi:MAG TPA: SRPBCC family protein [Ignavibacteria bacterium]|jgi:uncharacterized protein YndB with AHSA1/START domain
MSYSFTVQKTIKAPVKKSYNSFSKAKELSTWFTTNHKHRFREGGKYKNGDGDEGKYLEIKPNKLIRFTWENKMHCPGTDVTIRFRHSGKNKSYVKLTHLKLETQTHVKDMKMGWSWALTCLKSYLETGKRIGFDEWYKKKDLTT